MATSVAELGLSTINSYVFGVMSICSNSLLIYVIRKRGQCSRVIGAYKHMMIGCAVLDICFSIVYIVASPTFAATSEMSALLIVNGGFLMLNEWGRILLVLFVWLLCQSILTPTCLFVFRYFQICRINYSLEPFRRMRYFFTVPLLISSSLCGLICFAAWPTESDLAFFNPIAYDINVSGNTAYLVATLHVFTNGSIYDVIQSDTLFIATVLTIIVLLTTMIIMIFCSTKIVQLVMNKTSGSTRNLHIQLCKTLVAQFISPFILLHVPFYVSILAPLFEGRTGEASNYFPFLFAWCPAINPFITIYFVREYREFVLLRCRCKAGTSSCSTFLIGASPKLRDDISHAARK